MTESPSHHPSTDDANREDARDRERRPAAEERDAHGEHDVMRLGGGEQEQQDGDGLGGKDAPKPPSRWVFVVAGLVLVGALGWGGYTHWRSYSASQQTAQDTTERAVDVRTTEAKRQDQPMALTLPGQTDAFDTANIYPRATGYIGERRVDIGSRVRKGDLLVHIVAPDLDQQLAQAQAQIGQTRAAKTQAEAQVTQAQASVALAQVTFNRTDQLTGKGYETLQNRDNQQANLQNQQAAVESAKAGVAVADANIKAQQATIDRLSALTAFEDVRAPFDGVVTSRSVDTGDLLNADMASATPMFTLARDDVIRVTVRVPQSEAMGVIKGIPADVTVPQLPGRVFKGTVTRSSDALLYSSRTLTTEVDVPNPDDALRAGLYVSVTLQVPRSEPTVTVPAEALMFNQHGMQVASVQDNKAKIQQVTISRDHGTTVDLREGLKGGERVILEPPATLADGAKVKEHRTEDDKKPDDKKPDDQQKQAAPKDGEQQQAATAGGKPETRKD